MSLLLSLARLELQHLKRWLLNASRLPTLRRMSTISMWQSKKQALWWLAFQKGMWIVDLTSCRPNSIPLFFADLCLFLSYYRMASDRCIQIFAVINCLMLGAIIVYVIATKNGNSHNFLIYNVIPELCIWSFLPSSLLSVGLGGSASSSQDGISEFNPTMAPTSNTTSPTTAPT